jgi:hypothetical protein
MAVTKEIIIDVKSGQAQKDVEKINNLFKEVDKSVDEAEKSTVSLRTELRKIQQDLASGKLTGEAFTKASQRAGQLKDAIGDVSQRVNILSSDTQKLDLALSVGSGLAGGFSAAQGAMGLFGTESEKINEAILKVQSSLSLLNGVQAIANTLNKDSALMVQLQSKGFLQLIGVQQAYTAIVGTSTGALKALKVALIATGIGALVVAMGTIVAYWDDIKTAVSGISSQQIKLNEDAQKNVDIQKDKLDKISGQENILKLQGKSERDILKMKISQTDEIIKATEAQIKQADITAKAQIAASQRNKDILKGILDFISKPLQIVLSAIDGIGQAFGKDFGLSEGLGKLIDGSASLIFDPANEKAKAEEARKEAQAGLEKLKNDRAGFELSLQNMDKQSSDKRKALQDDAEKKRLEALERIRQAEIATEEQRRSEELKKIKDQYTALIAEAEKYGRDTIDLKIAQQAKIDELEDKWAEEAKQKELAKRKAIEDILKVQQEESNVQKLQREQAEKLLELERLGASELERKAFIMNTNKEIQKAKDDEAKAELARQQILEQQKIELVSNSLGLMSEILRQNSKAGKAFAVAQAFYNTYQGITAELQTKTATPFEFGLKLFNIAKASAIGFGAVKNILKTNPMAPNAAATPVGGGSASAPPPQFNVVGGNVANQIGQVLGNQPPVQAFVVGSQVTSQQAMDRNIITNASLG